MNEDLELQILKNISNISNQKSLAQDIGYSVGKINYILKALTQKGFVKSERFLNSNNKVQYKYILTQKGIKEKISITEKFIQRKKEEYEELQNDMAIYKEKYTFIDLEGNLS